MPQQARSRQRVEAILEASGELILEQGATELKMSDVAERAGIPIGSLYQYFPTRVAIVARIYQDYLAQGRVIAVECLEAVTNRSECEKALRLFVHKMHDFNRGQTVMRDIWCAAQAERAIRAVYQKEHDFYAQTLFETALRGGSPLKTRHLRLRATLVYKLWLSTLDLAIGIDKPAADEIVNESLGIGLRMIGIADPVI